MLPDRSKRYAGIDGDIPRLGLASTWQLFLMALLVLALLVLIFPRKELVEKLYAQESLDELTLSYIQNLYRANTRNADVAILLARVEQNHLDLPTLEGMLLQPATQGDARQRTEAQMILLKAYARALDSSKNTSDRASLKFRVSTLMHAALEEALPERLAQTFANLAYELDLPALGSEFLDKVKTGRSANGLERYAHEALSKGEYALASEYYLMARDRAQELSEARRLYKAGVDALMAASLFGPAMQSAKLHLGTLSTDAPTLRYLAHTALAAGDPAQAAAYARALVFQTTTVAP